MKHKLAMKAFFIFVFVILIAACASGADADVLSASGMISAAAVDISPQVSGQVQDVYIRVGDQVKEGDRLFSINDEFIKAQYDQAAAGLSVAQAAVTAAQEQKNAAEVQLAQAEQGARYQALETSAQTTPVVWPDTFDLPQWYFDDNETMTAIQAEVDLARETLAKAKTELSNFVASFDDSKLSKLEADLAQSQVAYLLLQQQLVSYQQTNASQAVIDTTQKDLDETQADLDRLQLAYDRALSDTENEDLLDARAKVQAAQDHLDLALLAMDQLQVGERSLMIEAAKANVALAEANIGQAQAGLEQAQAAEGMAALQLEKTILYAPLDGVVMSESLAPGELVGAGMKSLTIAQLKEVELTVYIPEDQYGQVSLGQTVQVMVDSFPTRTFTGEVVFIADEAEFTPRNVQTVEGRKATVFAVKILIPNLDFALKPGMPADVIFN